MPPVGPNRPLGAAPLSQFTADNPPPPAAAVDARASSLGHLMTNSGTPVGAGTGSASRAHELQRQAGQTLSAGELQQLAAFLGASVENLREITGRLRFVDGDRCRVLETVRDDLGKLTEKKRLLHLPVGEEVISSEEFELSKLPEERLQAVQNGLAQMKALLHKFNKDLSPEEAEACLRARFEAQLNDGVDTGSTLGTAVALTTREASARFKSVFAGKIRPEARQEATIRVDSYLDYCAKQPVPAVPPEVRQTMIGFDMLMADLRRTIDIKTNFLSRKPNPKSSEHDARYGKGEVDIEEMEAKNILQSIRNLLDFTLARKHNSIEKWMAVDAATSLVTGSATCDGYAGLLAFRISQICSQLQGQFEEISLSRVQNPTISLHQNPHSENAESEGKEVKHAALLVHLKTKDGNRYTILLDPWSEINTPVLKEHISFMDDSEKINAKVVPLNFQELSVVNVQREVGAALQLLPAAMQHPNMSDAAQGDLMKTIDHEESYSLTHLAKDVFTDPLGANSTMRLPEDFLVRPTTLTPQYARTSPLVQWVRSTYSVGGN